MALTVGTDSFISVADADTYWSKRSNSDWTAADPSDKETALINATDYLNNAYDWPGVLADTDQALSWPRDSAYDLEGRKLTGIPKPIEDATAYLAGQSVAGTVLFEVHGQAEKRLKAGSVEIEYMDHSTKGNTYEYLKSILSVLTYTGSSQIRLVRS